MIINAANIDNFFKGLDFRFQMGREAAPTFWKDVATMVPSTTRSNVYPWLQKIPGLREWIGPRVINNIKGESYELVNRKFEDTISVDKDDLADDNYGFYGNIAAELGAEVEEFPDQMIAEVVEAGVTSVCWDGQFFFDTDHPVDTGGVVSGVNSNKLVGATYDLTGNSGDPLVAFAAARAAMRLWKRPDGRQTGNVGNVIMVHPNEEKQARQVASAINLGQVVGSGAATPSNVFQGEVSVIVNSHLKVTAGKPWYLLATNRPVKPFLYQLRQNANLVAKTNNSDDNVFFLDKFIWGVDLRAAFGYTFPQLAFRMSAS